MLVVAADNDRRVESVSKDNPRLTLPKTPASSTECRSWTPPLFMFTPLLTFDLISSCLLLRRVGLADLTNSLH